MKKLFFVMYFLLLILFALFTYLFVDQNFVFLNSLYSGYALTHRVIVSMAFVLFVLSFYAIYVGFLLHTPKKISLKTILITSLISVGILSLSYPAIVSYDIFNYIASAKTLFYYFENPYIIMPIDFLDDPILLFMHAANKVALYGPVWILLSGLPFLAGFGNFLLTLFFFKIFVLVFYFGIVILVWRMTKHITSVIFFALNPLVIFETAVSGHNDVVMMFFAMVGMYLLQKNRFILAVILLLLSVFIKFATVLLLPIFLYVYWRKRLGGQIDWNKMYVYAALLMLLAIMAAPFREEIYPWYAIWVLSFIALLPKRRLLLLSGIVMSCFLSLRYIPFMLLGTHFGITPFLKISMIVIPGIFLVLLLAWNKMPFLKHSHFLKKLFTKTT